MRVQNEKRASGNTSSQCVGRARETLQGVKFKDGAMDLNVPASPDSYVEALTLNLLVSGGGPLGGHWV